MRGFSITRVSLSVDFWHVVFIYQFQLSGIIYLEVKYLVKSEATI